MILRDNTYLIGDIAKMTPKEYVFNNCYVFTKISEKEVTITQTTNIERNSDDIVLDASRMEKLIYLGLATDKQLESEEVRKNKSITTLHNLGYSVVLFNHEDQNLETYNK